MLTIGVGTPEGGSIPITPNQVKMDEEGKPVQTKLNEKILELLATAGGGQAFNLAQGDAVLMAFIRNQIDQLEKQEMMQLSIKEFESYFQWFLVPALLLLFFEFFMPFRFKKTAITALLAFLLGICPPNPGDALKRQGDRLYQKRDFSAAEEKYRKAADLDKNSATNTYNLGNAVYEQGRYEQAGRVA